MYSVLLSIFANKNYYPSINIYLKIYIASFSIYKFAIDINELQNTLKMEIFAA